MLQVFVTEYTLPEKAQLMHYLIKDGKNKTVPAKLFLLIPKAGHKREH